jgi:hypothetical protein
MSVALHAGHEEVLDRRTELFLRAQAATEKANEICTASRELLFRCAEDGIAREHRRASWRVQPV